MSDRTGETRVTGFNRAHCYIKAMKHSSRGSNKLATTDYNSSLPLCLLSPSEVVLAPVHTRRAVNDNDIK